MSQSAPRTKISVYLEDSALRRKLKVAATRRDMTLSEFCLQAIREKLAREGEGDEHEPLRTAARRMDERRQRLGPLPIRVADLVEEGRRR